MDLLLLEQKYIRYLDTLALTTLRILGRRYGVSHASALHKKDLVDNLAGIFCGRITPLPQSKRGAPAKNTYVEPGVIAEIDRIKKDLEREEKENFVVLTVESGRKSDNIYEQPVSTGILEITQSGYGFIRAKNCQPSSEGDVFVSAPAIHNLKLREGDYIVCTSQPRLKNDSPALAEVLSVNGREPGRYETRPNFDSLSAQYASEKIELSDGCDDLSLRLLDLFVPIGKGQRGLIIAPPKAGKTTLLKSIANAVSERHKDMMLIILLIDERPEEVTDIQTSVRNAEVIYSTFDEGAEHHIRAAELTLAHAKRYAELGCDVMILLDSLTKLTRAYNFVVESTGKTLTGGLDVAAFFEPKRFFGSARNIVGPGSLTILATALVETGSRMDDIIYEEFKGTGNADIFLSRELAERRIFPAIDIRRSGTRKEELLLPKDHLEIVYKMRERGLTENAPGLLEMIRKTSSNQDFLTRLPEWLRVYKNM